MLGAGHADGAIARPFASAKEAIGFTLLLGLLLALPFVLAALGVPRRDQVYRTVPLRQGDWDRVHEQVFERTEPIDVLFLGASQLWAAIDAPAVQRAFAEHLGREVNVQALGVLWRGQDKFDLILRDLLARRRVGLLVMTTPTASPVRVGPDAFHWSSRRDAEAGWMDGLGAVDRTRFLAAHVLGAPRHLLSVLRPNRSVEGGDDGNRGSRLLEIGWHDGPFVPLDVEAPRFTLAEIDRAGVVTGQPPNAYQTHFFRRILERVAEAGSGLTLVSLPDLRDRARDGVPQSADWSRVAGRALPTLAPSPRRLFAGLKEDQVKQLYYDGRHFNANGARFFTAAILPALLEVYDGHAR